MPVASLAVVVVVAIWLAAAALARAVKLIVPPPAAASAVVAPRVTAVRERALSVRFTALLALPLVSDVAE